MGKLKKAGIACGLAGLLCWGIIFIADICIGDVSYPHILFRIFQPLGLFLIFLAVPLFALSWIISLYWDFKTRNYSAAAISIVSAVIIIIGGIIRLL